MSLVRPPARHHLKQPSEFHYFTAWLLFFAATTVGIALVGMMIGLFGGAELSAPEMKPILGIIGVVIPIPISYIAFRVIVGKYLFPKIADDDDVPPMA